MDLSLPIDTVAGISEEEFLQRYFYPQKPVIIKGLTRGTAAEGKWSLGYMKEKLGHATVEVFDNRQQKSTAYTFGDFRMHFSDFVDTIQKDETCPYRLFLFNGFKHSPGLKKEFPCPTLFKGLIDHIGLMFFGGKDTGVRIHYDIDMSNVLHTQFSGKKRILLFSPLYSDLLYKVPFGTYSLVNFENPDYEKFPALHYLAGYEIILEEGDSLFMPAGYWHYMHYLEGGFAVTYRKLAPGLLMKLQGLLNITFRLWIDKAANYLFPGRWLAYRTQRAYTNANQAIALLVDKETRLSEVV